MALHDLVAQARSACTRWEFATDEYHSFDPLAVELQAHSGAIRGRLLTKEPASGEYFRFGFAANGGLRFSELVKSLPFIECRYGDAKDSICVAAGGGSARNEKLVSVALRSMIGDDYLVARWGARGRWRVMLYKLDGEGRPKTVTDWTTNVRIVTAAEYDSLGRLSSLIDRDSGYVQWRRPSSSVREMLVWYEGRLYTALEPVLEHAAQALDAVVLALAYNGGGGEGLLPPQVAATSIRLMRQAAPGSPFDPHNMCGDIRGDEEPGLRIGDEQLLEVSRAIGFEVGADTERVTAMLRRVAKRLSRKTWLRSNGARGPVAVFVANLDAGEWDRDFAACVSRRQRRALKKGVGG